ncbi:MAG: adenylate/guanylate cyclase domain-containing protein [Gammaproteobacteria bacterium]|nr:adenylate/guanylate cyclase domain-containing protein [Gammaproteobacteria bacterium]
MKNLFIFTGAWAVAIGLLILLSVSIPEGTFISHLPGGRVLLWPLASILLGLVSWGLNFINDSIPFRKKSFIFIVFFNVFFLFISVLLFLLLVRATTTMIFGFSTLAQVFLSMLTTFLKLHFWALMLYILVVQGILNFIEQMANMIGPRILFHIILGHYRQPKTEERIFMFLDLQGSTTVAERLGHEQFCRLIQDCFADLTQSALVHEVEIYQYVGDEAILTWDKAKGFKEANCLRVFYDFNDTLATRSSYYMKKYQYLPVFKAGVNMGKVAVAEIGTIKRNIAYLSDVLNTAARIENLCNEIGKPLLISEEVKTRLGEVSGYEMQFTDEIKLRGKNKLVKIYSVERTT